jgi:hypothetical protein
MDFRNIGADTVISGLFGLGTLVTLGIVDASLLNYTLDAVAFTLPKLPVVGAAEVTNASAMSVAALGTVWALNQPSVDRFSPEEKALGGATVALVLAGIFAPDLLTPISAGASVPLAVTVWGVQGGGYWVFATGN